MDADMGVKNSLKIECQVRPAVWDGNPHGAARRYASLRFAQVSIAAAQAVIGGYGVIAVLVFHRD
jgi:hypothetical protein